MCIALYASYLTAIFQQSVSWVMCGHKMGESISAPLDILGSIWFYGFKNSDFKIQFSIW